MESPLPHEEFLRKVPLGTYYYSVSNEYWVGTVALGALAGLTWAPLLKPKSLHLSDTGRLLYRLGFAAAGAITGPFLVPMVAVAMPLFAAAWMVDALQRRRETEGD